MSLTDDEVLEAIDLLKFTSRFCSCLFLVICQGGMVNLPTVESSLSSFKKKIVFVALMILCI